MATISLEESAAKVEELAEGAVAGSGSGTTSSVIYHPPHEPNDPPVSSFSFKLTEPANQLSAPSTGVSAGAGGTFTGALYSVQSIEVTFTFAPGTPQQVVKVASATWEEFGDGYKWKTPAFSFKAVGDANLRVHAVATWRNNQTGKVDTRLADRTVTIHFTDAQIPTVTIHAPSTVTDHDGVYFPVPFSVTASDNVGVASVVYWVDGVGPTSMTLDSGTSGTGTWISPTTPKLKYASGPAAHRIDVTAYDVNNLPGSQTQLVTTKDVEKPAISLNADDTISLPAREDGSALLPELSGVVEDKLSGIGSVLWVLDPPSDLNQAVWKTASLTQLSAAGDHGHWTTGPVTIPAGIHRIVVRAIDKAGNQTDPLQRMIEVQPTYPPVDPTVHEYLRSLVDFICNRFTLSGANVTPAVLRGRLQQPFPELVSLDPLGLEVDDQRRDSELRLVVEALRHRFEAERINYADLVAEQQPGASAAKLADAVAKRKTADAIYRQRAYEAILDRLGASLPELRDAVRGDQATQQALADRLGIELGGGTTGPNNLRRLLLEPPQVDEPSLAQLFGLAAFPPAGQPTLPGTAVAAALLGSLQAERLDGLWGQQDRERPGAVVDPDVITEADLPPGTTPASALLHDRQDWLDSLLEWMRAQPMPASGPPSPPTSRQPAEIPPSPDPKNNPLLQRFDGIVASVLGAVSRLLELDARQRAGEDVEADLAAIPLSLSAFARLMAVRRVVAANEALDVDWEDAYAILVNTAKVRAYPQWRSEEQAAGVTLSPVFFLAGTAERAGEPLSPWRTVKAQRQRWRATLQGRTEQRATLRQVLASAVDAAERDALPLLRDGIVAALQPLQPIVTAASADALSRVLFIDVVTDGTARMSRVDFAVQSLQALLLAVRAGTGGSWARKVSTESQDKFDEELRWMGSYANWYAAMRVFLYPENMLYPTLRPLSGPHKQSAGFQTAVASLRQTRPFTSDGAETVANTFGLSLARTPDELGAHRANVSSAIGGAALGSIPVQAQEKFYYLPLAIALQLHRSGQYLAALDWFRMVYAYDLPPAYRKTWGGLAMERDTSSQPRKFRRKLVWLQDSLNPYDIVQASYADPLTTRYDVHTRFVVTSIVRCLLDFADGEFVQDTNESLPRARSLYRIALDLLALPELNPVPVPGLTPNDVTAALRRRAQVALAKLHTGRNAAGLVRQIEPVRPITTGSGSSPLVVGGSPFGSDTVRSQQPTPYRYATLIERTKQLANIAQQVEQTYLAALEKRDAEAYSLLKARQDLNLASANVVLQQKRGTESADGITLAELQRERADTQVREYQALLDQPMNTWENKLIADYSNARRARDILAGIDAAITSFQAIQAASTGSVQSVITAPVPTGAIIGLALNKADQTMKLNGIDADIQRHTLRASVENRVREWRMQQAVARKDVAIAGQQVRLAMDRQAIVAQEGVIAQLQFGNAQATLEFLAGKFTNVELYEWMIDVLADVYGYFLQQATSLGQFAQNQLAFETQQPVPVLVRKDYWRPLDDGVLASTAEPDRRGLTGSARLLRDVYELDQFAFENNRRKLQLTKTLSLARLAPVEFEEFRRTGVLTFATPMSLFDQDFPGHYLRLVKRVRVSVVALVPPHHGIKATLTNAGVSRVVIGGDSFQTVRLVRDAEQVALTSPTNATGVFELDLQPELLLPFELSGVDSLWNLEMPKAANAFDFHTIADVLVMFEYTALASTEYRQKVIAQLDRTASADRLFSLRDQFPDQWYDLHNPQAPTAPVTIGFDVSADDFPANLDGITTSQLGLYIVLADGVTGTPIQVSLDFSANGERPVGGTASSTSGGIVSTRLGNGAPWTVLLGQSPFGRWRVTFPETATIRALLDAEAISDIAMVVSYTGRTPQWPD
jgi:hypothetical protein